jgi:hypothetical protein
MSLRADRRGQSIQIGAILLFAVLVVLFAVYQSVIVPNQNREVEFNHNQRVEADMIEVRNTLLETFSSGKYGYASVELGTEFPPRLIAMNPPPPSGTLQSRDLRPISIVDDGVDITDTVCPGNQHSTRFVEYNPSYSAYSEAGTIRFENTVVYHEFRDGTVQLTGQSLVRNQTVQIVPITGNISAGGSQTAALEPIPGLLDSTQRDGITVTLPTALSEPEWERILEGEVAPGNVQVSSDELTLTLPGTRQIECGPVGLGSVPPSGQRGGDRTEINPAAPGDIRLEDEGLEPGTSSEVVLRLNNTAKTNNITEARINFYQSEESSSQQAPTQAVLRPRGGTDRATLVFREDFTTVSPKIEVAGETTTEITLDFSNSQKTDPNLNSGSWFVVTYVLETGETGTYFVPIPSNDI